MVLLNLDRTNEPGWFASAIVAVVEVQQNHVPGCVSLLHFIPDLLEVTDGLAADGSGDGQAVQTLGEVEQTTAGGGVGVQRFTGLTSSAGVGSERGCLALSLACLYCHGDILEWKS
jgi:hypothetical protein